MDMSGSNLNEAEQQALGQIMQRRMVQDLMRFVNGLTQQCFEGCVQDFSSKQLSNQEDLCINRCAQKVRYITERATMRFQEEAANEMSKQQAASRR